MYKMYSDNPKTITRVFIAMLIAVLVLLTIYVSGLVSKLEAADRSSCWNKTREAHIKLFPYCEVCGTSKDLQVHHIKPFHMFPLLECDKDNLVTLCTSKYWEFNCHLIAGHGGNFRSYNRWVMEDIGILKVYGRPDYIREFGLTDRDEYIKMIKARVKKFNKELKEDGSL